MRHQIVKKLDEETMQTVAAKNNFSDREEEQ